MLNRLLAAGATALLLIAFGVFWMFVWLVGTNGYSGAQGGRILAANLVWIIVVIVAASVASAWLANKLRASSGWSVWAVAPLASIGASAVAVAALIAGSILIIIVLGRTT